MTWPNGDDEDPFGDGTGPASTGSDTGDGGTTGTDPLDGAASGDDTTTGRFVPGQEFGHLPGPGGGGGGGGGGGSGYDGPTLNPAPSDEDDDNLTSDDIESYLPTDSGIDSSIGAIDSTVFSYSGADLESSIAAWAEANPHVMKVARGLSAADWANIKAYEQAQRQKVREPAKPEGGTVEGPMDDVSPSDCDSVLVVPTSLGDATHFLYLESDDTEAYSRIAINNERKPVVGRIQNSTRVYLYPEEEFIGIDCEWAKVRPAEGDLSGQDVYVYCSDLKPLGGTKTSLVAVCPPDPEPDAFVPNWTRRGACSPWYNARTQKYCTTVTTDYKSIPAEDVDTIKQSTLSSGIKQLLNYYSRRPVGYDDPEEAANFLIDNSYHVATAEELYLSPRPNSKVKSMVSIHAKYFHAIPRRIPSMAQPRNGVRTVMFNSFTIEDDFKYASSTLSSIQDNVNSFKGTIKDFSPKKESKKLPKFLSALKELIRVNGHELRTDHEDLIEVAMDKNFNPMQVVLYQESSGTNLDVGFNSFSASPGVSSPRTMHYVAQLHNMNSYAKAQRLKVEPFNWMQYCTNYTYPGLEIRYTSKMTPGLNTKQLRADAADAIKKFNSMPFKDPAQLSFEIGKLSDPDFLRNMSLGRANLEIAIGDPVLANLEDILDEINTLDDLFGKFLGKVEIPKLIQMAMSALMDQMEFPDLFESLLGAIMGNFSLEMILDEILANLDLSVQVSIFADLLENLNLPTDCYMSFFSGMGITIPSLRAAIPDDIMSAELASILSVESGYSDEEGFGLMAELDPSVLIQPIIQMIISGIPEVEFAAGSITLDLDLEGNVVAADDTTTTRQTVAGTTSKLPKITSTKIKKAFFATCEECAGVSIPDIISTITTALKTQISLGSSGSSSGSSADTAGGSAVDVDGESVSAPDLGADLDGLDIPSIGLVGPSIGVDIDFLRNLPPISAGFDLMLGDPNLNLNMEIPSLPGVSLEMPSLNVDLPSIPSLNIPTITLPDNIPTLDIMGYIFDAMLAGIQGAIEAALVEMAKSVIRSLLGEIGSDLGDLSFGEANIGDLMGSSLGSISAADAQISQVFEPLGVSSDGYTMATEEEMAAALSTCSADTSPSEYGTPADFLDEVSEAINLTEMGELLRGVPTEQTCETIQDIVVGGYHNMAHIFMDCDKLKDVFGEIGESVDIRLVDDVIPQRRKVANKLDYLCGVLQSPVEEDSYRQVMKNKGLDDDQVEEQLQAEKQRQKDALEDLASLLADVQSGSVLDGIIPPVYPEECGGPALMPPDSEIPEMTFVNELALDAMYAGVQMAWKAETSGYFENFIDSNEVGDVVNKYFNPDAAATAKIENPKFKTLYSQGFPLCDSEGNIYTDPTIIEAIKLLESSGRTNGVYKLTNALNDSELEVTESAYYRSFDEEQREQILNWMRTITGPWLVEQGLPADGSDFGGYTYQDVMSSNLGEFHNEVNVLVSELSSSISSAVTGAYDGYVINTWANDPRYTGYDNVFAEWYASLLDAEASTETIIFNGGDVDITYYDRYKSSADGAYVYKRYVAVDGPSAELTNNNSYCSAQVSGVEQSCSPTTSIAVNDAESEESFYSNVSKESQTYVNLLWDAWNNNSVARELSSDSDPQRVVFNTYGDQTILYFDPAARPSEKYKSILHMAAPGVISVVMEEAIQQAQHSSENIQIDFSPTLPDYDIVYPIVDSERTWGKVFDDIQSGAVTIEPATSTCGGKSILDASKAKDEAMDDINSCPSGPTPEGEKSNLESGAMTGLVGMTLRAYIADVLLRGWVTLRGYAPHKPSALMIDYIYQDLISDMSAIDDEYKTNFLSEAATVYSKKEYAEDGLTETEIMHALISEQYEIVYPAIMKNLTGSEALVCKPKYDKVKITDSKDFVYYMILGKVLNDSGQLWEIPSDTTLNNGEDDDQVFDYTALGLP